MSSKWVHDELRVSEVDSIGDITYEPLDAIHIRWLQGTEDKWSRCHHFQTISCHTRAIALWSQGWVYVEAENADIRKAEGHPRPLGRSNASKRVIACKLGQFTRNYTQTTKRGLLTTNKGWISSTGEVRDIQPALLFGVSKGAPFGTRLCLQSVVCYTLCRCCCENEVANWEGKGIWSSRKARLWLCGVEPQTQGWFYQQTGRIWKLSFLVQRWTCRHTSTKIMIYFRFRMVSTVCCGVWLELSSQKPILGGVCINVLYNASTVKSVYPVFPRCSSLSLITSTFGQRTIASAG